MSNDGEKIAEKLYNNQISLIDQIKHNQIQQFNEYSYKSDNSKDDSKNFSLISIDSDKENENEKSKTFTNFSNFKNKLNTILESKSEDKKSNEKNLNHFQVAKYKIDFGIHLFISIKI